MAELTEEQAKWIETFVPSGLIGVIGAPAGAGGAGPGDQTIGGSVSASPFLATDIASLVTPAPQPGNHGSWHDKSKLEFTSGYSFFWVGPDDSSNIVRAYQAFDERITLGFRVPGKGRLTLKVTVEGKQDNGLLHRDETFTQDLTAIWQVSADEQGKLTIVQDSTSIGQHEGDTNYRLDGDANVFNTAPLVGMRPRFIGTSDGASSESGKSISISGGNDKLGGGGSISWGDGTSSTKGPPAVQTSIVIELNPIVPKAKPAPEPHGTVTVSNEVGALGRFEFVIQPFKIGKAVLESGGLADEVRNKVWSALSEDEQTALIQGELAGQKWPDGADTLKGQKIEVHGYASNTDTKDHNLKFSLDRAQAVIDILKKFGIPDSTFTKPVPHGEWDSVGDDEPGPTDVRKHEKESAEWRKVVVKMMVARIYKV